MKLAFANAQVLNTWLEAKKKDPIVLQPNRTSF